MLITKIKNLVVTFPVLKSVYHLYVNIRYREKKESWGDQNPDKVYYVIGLNDKRGGLWWLINKVVMHLAYSDEKGYIPVVDFKNFHTQYQSDSEFGKVNVWEKFFLQPCGVSLDDIKQCKNIIISDQYASPSEKYLMGNTDFYENPEKLKFFQSILRKYIKFSPQTLQLLNNSYNEVIPQNKRILGVLCRGTDYALKKPSKHPIQPSPEQVIVDSKIAKKKYNCDYIFLATEDEDILTLFKKEFGESLLYINQVRVSRYEMNNVNTVAEINVKKNTDKYMMGVNYLKATYILSKCNCFIAGRTGGTKGALLMSENFEYTYIYNLGFYD